MSYRGEVVSQGNVSYSRRANMEDRTQIWKRFGDPGFEMVRAQYTRLKIDPEWLVVTGNGFTWWGHNYAQRIWADDPFESEGVLVTRVYAQTDFLKYPIRSEEVEARLAIGMAHASLSGLVVYEDSGKIRLQCSALVNNGSVGWLMHLFSWAVSIQCSDAESKAEDSAKTLGLEPDRSEHPDSGPRTEKDFMLNCVEQFVIPFSLRTFRQVTMDDMEMVAEVLDRSGIITNKAGGGMIIGVVPVSHDIAGGIEAILNVSLQMNPMLRKGLKFLLRISPEVFQDRGIEVNGRLIMDLNTLEAKENTLCHSMGSWCLEVLHGNRTATYVSFVPAIACNPDVLEDMALSTAAHAKWLNNLLQAHALGPGF